MVYSCAYSCYYHMIRISHNSSSLHSQLNIYMYNVVSHVRIITYNITIIYNYSATMVIMVLNVYALGNHNFRLSTFNFLSSYNGCHQPFWFYDFEKIDRALALRILNCCVKYEFDIGICICCTIAEETRIIRGFKNFGQDNFHEFSILCTYNKVPEIKSFVSSFMLDLSVILHWMSIYWYGF